MEHYLQLSSAFYRVGLMADKTWWTEEDFKDKFKLASHNLWNEVIDSNERLSKWGTSQESTGKQNNNANAKSLEKQILTGNSIFKRDKLVMPTCRMEVAQVQKSLSSMDPTALAPLSQSILADTRCILSSNWALALLKTYPAISNALKNNSALSVFSEEHDISSANREGKPLPYSLDSVEEFTYYKKLACRSVKNVWQNNKEKVFDKTVWEPKLNANVPEFYPSVLLPPRQCPPRYSNVFGANYQSEVFPYAEEKVVEKDEQDVGKGKRKRRRGASEQRSTQQMEGIASTSSPNLRGSLKKSSPRALGMEYQRSNLNNWLQNVYPLRVVDLSKIKEISAHFESVAHGVALPFQPVTPQAASSAFAPNERRLYRDVLARKTNEVDKTKDEPEQNPFDELERQALEQYQSSETCLVNPTENCEINPDTEDSKFQDLEREALEQYAEDGDDQMERNLESSSNIPSVCYTLRTQPINLRYTQFKGSHSKTTEKDTNLNEAAIEPEDIVNSVVGDDKTSDRVAVLSTIENKGCKLLKSQSPDSGRNKNKTKRNKRKKKKQGDEDKFTTNSMHSAGGQVSYQLPSLINIEEETRRLATNLKQRVLNYLRSVDVKKIKELDESKRNNLKHQVSKDSCDRPIQERIRVNDINDLDTYRTYIREVSTKARSSLLLQFKRIRTEIMESTSRGIVALVGPTTSEKRRVRQIIKKCLELRNHADKTPKNPLNGVKREVNEILETVHNTMEVIYKLSNLSKEAFKDVEFLKSGKTIVTELYSGNTTLEDKSEYIKQRVMTDERSILLFLLFPRTPGVLFDRSLESTIKPSSRLIYYDHDLLSSDYAALPKNISTLLKETKACSKFYCFGSYQDKNVKVYNSFEFTKMESTGIWNPDNWSHVTELGKIRRRVNFVFSSTGRQMETFGVVFSRKLAQHAVTNSERPAVQSTRKRHFSNYSECQVELRKKL